MIFSHVISAIFLALWQAICLQALW